MEQFEQTILTALQTKFDGVDAKILGRIAKKLAKTVTAEDQVQTAVDGVTFQQVLESYGDSRATDATHSAVANYEKKHGIKDGKPVENPGQQQQAQAATARPAQQPGATQPTETVPAWAQTLIESNEALKKRLDEQDAERTARSRLDIFKKAVSSAPEIVRTRYERDFARLTFKDDDDFNAYLEEIRPDIEKMATESAQRGGTVTKPLAGGGQPGGISPLVQSRIDAQKAATASPAIQGLPTQTK